MKNLTIIALSIVFITLSVFFAACQKEKIRTSKTLAEEYPPYGFPINKNSSLTFRLEATCDSFTSVMIGNDFYKTINWRYSKNESQNFNTNLIIDWQEFPASDIISKSANQIIFKAKTKNDNIILDNIVADNETIQFELHTNKNDESIKVHLEYKNVDFSTFTNYNLTEIDAENDSKILVIPLLKVMKIIYGAACLAASTAMYYCNKKISEEEAACKAQGLCHTGVICGVKCIECPKN